MVWENRFEFEAIGTSWIIEFSGLKKSPEMVFEMISDEIKQFSSIFSRFDKNSEVFKAGEKGGEITFPEKYLPLVNLYQDLYKITDGLFTPLIGNLLSDSGYDDNYSLKQKELRPVLKWPEVLEYDPPKLKFKKPWLLDFGAAGKGFIVDIVGNILEEQGVESYCIDAGGDILYKGEGLLKVGLEHPENTKQVLGVAEIKNTSICGSSGNRRKWGNMHHILNPKKNDSVRDVLAVWVIAETAALADGLSTSLFFVEAEKLMNKFKFEFLVIYPDYSFKKSENFPGQIYIA